MADRARRPRRARRPQDRLQSAPAKLGIFAALLVVLLAVAVIAGAAIDPDRGDSGAGNGDDAKTAASGHGGSAGHASASGGDTPREAVASDETAHPVRGLAVAENGLRLVIADRELRRDEEGNVRFRIVDDRGRTVRDFDVEHTKRMHVIVVRRDLSGFQHLHPEQDADGSWSLRLRLPLAGSYRLFADFSHDGRASTLAGDLHVDGRADLTPLPAPARKSVSDGGYDVRLDARGVRPGEAAALRFTITKNGRAVQTEPYLGAGGHLVALRDADLAFLHVHPTDHGHGADATTSHADSVDFAATFPTAGRYRLFLQFKHEGAVQTVAFTQEVR